MPAPRSYALPPSLALAALLLAAPDAQAQGDACRRLSASDDLQRWTQAVEQHPGPQDLTRTRWLRPRHPGEDPLADLDPQALRVVAVDLPRGASLVDTSCALARNLRLRREDTLIVASRVGLHAISPRLSYHVIRPLARHHNPHLKRDPRAATAAFARDLRDAMDRERHTRHLIAAGGALCLLLGAASLAWLLRATP